MNLYAFIKLYLDAVDGSMSDLNKARAIELLFICLQRCQIVSPTLSKQCKYVKQAVSHSLINIARFATKFISAGPYMHFSALNNQGHWRVIRRSRLKFYGFHKKRYVLKINETCTLWHSACLRSMPRTTMTLHVSLLHTLRQMRC